MTKITVFKGKQTGLIVKHTENGGEETYEKALPRDIKELSTSDKIKYATSIKAQSVQDKPKKKK